MPYLSLPFPQTHPDRLATLARLFGLESPELPGCRVLEIGCAAGGNLIPLAEQIPGVECIGIDRSARQIADGQRVVDALGYDNVYLLAAGVEDIDASFGDFDFIVCHGVYSWVAGTVQDAILRVCRERLRPDGIAYISYNTLPGWHMRGMIRDLMRHHTLAFPTPSQQVGQARAILDFLAQAVPAEGSAYGALLQQELEGLRNMPDAYIFHEHLEEVNEPLYFRDFVGRAARHGLKYLAEADFATMLTSRFEPEVAETIERMAPDIVGREQLMDFVCNRTFRQSLLIHRDRWVERTVPLNRIDGFWLASPVKPVDAEMDLAPGKTETFRTDGGATLTSAAPFTKAALLQLSAHWPLPIPWPRLIERAAAMFGTTATPDAQAIEMLRGDLMQCYTAGLASLHSSAPPLSLDVDERPAAGGLARHQASSGHAVTSLRHEQVTLDEHARVLLTWLDGSASRAELAERFRAVFPSAPDDAVDTLLAGLARAGLLVRVAPAADGG